MRLYLAGPDVFLPDPFARAARLKSLCRAHGHEGVSPLDDVPDMPAAWRDLPEARRIALCNEAHIKGCDALVANLTPFRGVSADVGTVFEVGFMRALGRPVFGWTNDPRLLFARTLAAHPARRDGTDWRDADDMLVEAFGMHDNLMIDAAILASGGTIEAEDVPPEARWTDLRAFERCLARLAQPSG